MQRAGSPRLKHASSARLLSLNGPECKRWTGSWIKILRALTLDCETRAWADAFKSPTERSFFPPLNSSWILISQEQVLLLLLEREFGTPKAFPTHPPLTSSTFPQAGTCLPIGERQKCAASAERESRSLAQGAGQALANGHLGCAARRIPHRRGGASRRQLGYSLCFVNTPQPCALYTGKQPGERSAEPCRMGLAFPRARLTLEGGVPLLSLISPNRRRGLHSPLLLQ